MWRPHCSKLFSMSCTSPLLCSDIQRLLTMADMKRWRSWYCSLSSLEVPLLVEVQQARGGSGMHGDEACLKVLLQAGGVQQAKMGQGCMGVGCRPWKLLQAGAGFEVQQAWMGHTCMG